MLAHDVDSAAHGVEMLFLTYKMDGIWDFPKKKDQSIVAFKYVFWDNEKVQKLFRLAMIQHQQQYHNHFFPNANK